MLPLHTDSISWEKNTQRNSTAGKATTDEFLILIAVGNYVIIEDHYVVYTLYMKGLDKVQFRYSLLDRSKIECIFFHGAILQNAVGTMSISISCALK